MLLQENKAHNKQQVGGNFHMGAKVADTRQSKASKA
jgi:hypothetical protein